MKNYEAFWKEVAELAREIEDINQQPHEKTARALCKEWGTSLKDTTNLLDKLVDSGKMGKRQAKCYNGRIATVYFPSSEDLQQT